MFPNAAFGKIIFFELNTFTNRNFSFSLIPQRYTGTVDTAGWIPVYVANLVNSNQPMNLATLRDLIVSVADMIMDVFKDLFNLDENNMKVDEIREIFAKNLSKYGAYSLPNARF